jgi:large subunit ribosomal protein L4
MEAPLYNQQGENVGTIALPDKLFHVRWNPDVVSQVVQAIQANRRHTTAHTKGRGDVRGGGKKPWRQKGTGRARHGSTRSPIWVGGGVTHGPSKEKNYTQKINKQARRKALAMVLTKKLKDEEIIFIDQFALSDAKTKQATALLKQFRDTAGKQHLGIRGGRALVFLDEPNQILIRAFRNLPFVDIEEARNMNVEKALLPKYVIITKSAVGKITA